MSLKITEHEINPANSVILVSAELPPGAGGASTSYVVSIPVKAGTTQDRALSHQVLKFQEGPVQGPKDVNGLTMEVLLAIVADRLRGFQFKRDEEGNYLWREPGPFACLENAAALSSVEQAMGFLHMRTRKRVKRGVEGTHTP